MSRTNTYPHVIEDRNAIGSRYGTGFCLVATACLIIAFDVAPSGNGLMAYVLGATWAGAFIYALFFEQVVLIEIVKPGQLRVTRSTVRHTNVEHVQPGRVRFEFKSERDGENHLAYSAIMHVEGGRKCVLLSSNKYLPVEQCLRDCEAAFLGRQSPDYGSNRFASP